MLNQLKKLDSILRGDATRISSLRGGTIDVPIKDMIAVITLLGVIYGMCMGSFAALRGRYDILQLVSSGLKFPLLFALTLAVTFPSLYVFNALVGSRLSMKSVLKLSVAAIGVMMAVAASLGPIVVFFSLSTTSYRFMQLLNVVMCAIAGLLGLAFLLRTLHRLVLVQQWQDYQQDLKRRSDKGENPPEYGTRSDPSDPDPDARVPLPELNDPESLEKLPAAALDRIGDGTHRRARVVFNTWVVVFALVGAQMSWVLRPFIGRPDKDFEIFRTREGNFFQGIFEALDKLF